MPSFAKGCLTDAMSINKFTCPTGPHSAVGNMTGNRCESDCRSRVANSIPARSHTFVEIDHEIMSKIILLPSTESFKKGCCQLQAKVCARSTGQLIVQACPGKSLVRSTDCPAMTIAVDLGRKATKQKKKQKKNMLANIYSGCVLEIIFLISQPVVGSFEHPKYMLKLMRKEINAILGVQTFPIWTYV